MAKGGLLMLFIISFGLIAIVEAVEVGVIQIVNAPSAAELAQGLLNSERQHTDNNIISSPTDEGLQIAPNEGNHSPSSICGTVNLNKIVDDLLNSLRKDIVAKGKDKLSIPNLNETFTKKIGFIKAKGEFNAEMGWVKNLSTIHRTADVIASSYGRWISVSCGFGLGHLELGYDKYKATFMDFGPQGKLDGVIGKNSILLNATVTWQNHTCTTTLNEFVLNQFGGLRLKITGLGPLNWLFSRISDWLLHHFKAQIKTEIENALREELENVVSKFDCSNYILNL